MGLTWDTAAQARVPAGSDPGYLSKKTAAIRLLFLYRELVVF